MSTAVQPLDVTAIRKDFPLVSRVLNGKPVVYLDSAVSGQMPLPVIERVSKYERNEHTNVHRGVSTLSFGARLSRQQPWLRLAEGAEAGLDGLALLDSHQVADTHSFLLHAEPHATSHQLHKCIVDGQARAIFNGQIRVAPRAQGTDARQQSRNLLLSEAARVDTKPQLEIYADDVKCSHGATVGQLDPEELFYLQSRGLNADDARNLLTYGFAADVLNRIPVASLRRALRQLVMARTQADSLGDLS